MNEITINDKPYPFELTMGGLLLFANKKGLKFIAIDSIDFKNFDVADIVLLVYCLLRSSALKHKVAFDFTLEQIEEAIYADDTVIQTLFSLFASSESVKK